VLGLGDIGPLAAKPVMEGKGGAVQEVRRHRCVRHRAAGENLDKLVDIIAALEPTFGGVNLEDIKAPDCFYVERGCASA
jgi:malate dehydrogenase (oxaloacetate-decarboxylating)(NADP+)